MKRSALIRRTPLRGASEPMKPSAIRPVNRKRRTRLRTLQFGLEAALIRALPCAVCSRPGPNHPHHVRSRGAGGRSDSLVALCPEHHALLHQIGRHTFAARYEVDLEEVAEHTRQEIADSVHPSPLPAGVSR